MGSNEVRHKRYLEDEDGKSCWGWPSDKISEDNLRKLMGCCLEIAVNFFFHNFVYTFGGEKFVQAFGGPIGARLTMAIARLITKSQF